MTVLRISLASASVLVKAKVIFKNIILFLDISGNPELNRIVNNNVKDIILDDMKI